MATYRARSSCRSRPLYAPWPRAAVQLQPRKPSSCAWRDPRCDPGPSSTFCRHARRLFGKETNKRKAYMTAAGTFISPNSKHFRIQQSSGDGMGERLVRRVRAGEMQVVEDYGLTDISPDNYDFRGRPKHPAGASSTAGSGPGPIQTARPESGSEHRTDAAELTAPSHLTKSGQPTALESRRQYSDPIADCRRLPLTWQSCSAPCHRNGAAPISTRWLFVL